MYYEPYQGKKKKSKKTRKRRRGFGEWLVSALLKLIALVLAVALLVLGLLYALPPGLFVVEPEGVNLALTDGLPLNCVNILLVGVDDLRDGAQRSDAVMIASVGYGKFKLTSVMRDTLVEIPGHGRSKLNAAYAYGGAEMVMRTLNQNFGLNLMHYAQVDYVSLVKLIDAIGGVELNVTEAERERVNVTMREAKKIFAPLGYTAHELTQYGEGIHLDGLQAASYARIRKIDSDYMRTGRHRALLSAIIKKLRDNLWNPALLYRLAGTVMESVNTNMSLMQILSLGEKALLAGTIDQMRMPVEGSFTDNGSSLDVTSYPANHEAFVSFVYD